MRQRTITIALGVGAALGFLAALNDRVRWDVGAVPRWTEGEPRFYQWREGAIYYEVAGPTDAPPLLLLHGIRLAASSYDWRKVFAALATHYRVFAPDLLGFGRSDRRRLAYNAELYADLWCDFVRDVIGRPTHVAACALSAAHAVMAAVRHPERFKSLLLVCPSGVAIRHDVPRLTNVLFRGMLQAPIIGQTCYNILVSHPILGYTLRQRICADPYALDEATLQDYYTISHQPGARWAPAAMLTGQLDCDLLGGLTRVLSPIHIAWADVARCVSREKLDSLAAVQPNLTVHVVEGAGLLIADEQPETLIRLILDTQRAQTLRKRSGVGANS